MKCNQCEKDNAELSIFKGEEKIGDYCIYCFDVAVLYNIKKAKELTIKLYE